MPYAAPYPDGIDLAAVRANFTNTLFGRTDGKLPDTVMPDYIMPVAGNNARGCLCSYLGTCDAFTCTWSSNLTHLIFTTSVAVNASYTLAVNSTVHYSLNTSGVAPVGYPAMGPAIMPGEDGPVYPPLSRSRVLVLIHNGHASPCDNRSCSADWDGSADVLNQLGYDTMSLDMPGIACNQIPAQEAEGGCANTGGHAWFQQFEQAGVPIGRFFIEPIIRAVNYATSVLGYESIAMIGLSGGGWSTTMAAAADPRIRLSVPVAGSIPCDFHHTSWDYEQYCNHTYLMVANYSTLYALAALEPGRAQVQVLHEQDPCCHHGCGRHDRIRQYNAWVRAVSSGAFATAVTVGNVHEFNPRDRVIISTLVDKLRVAGAVTQAVIDALPFNTMDEW